jgi:signal recognition particle receptor subunit beta
VTFFNYVTKEITLKVVYYGPGLSGKTTNLQYLYSVLDPSSRGKFISLATESDRTLFFDFLPVELGKIKDFSVRFQLYTVPGQIRYNATRKLVLKGADAVVFVADSQTEMREQNIESFTNMRENLTANNIDPDGVPVILQYNKRDLPSVLSVEELNKDLNAAGYQTIETVAIDGKGVEETFRLITKMLLKEMVRKHKVEMAPEVEEVVSKSVPEEIVPPAGPAFAKPQVAEPEEAHVEQSERETVFTPEEIIPLTTRESEEEKIEEVPERPLRQATAFTQEKVVSLKIPDEDVFEIEEPREQRTAEQPKVSAPVNTAAQAPAPTSPHPSPFTPTHAPTPSPSLAPPSYSNEKMDSLIAILPDIKQTLSGINQSLTTLSSALKESGKQQADMVRLLRDINHSLTANTKKRRWFHFGS